MEIMTQDLDEDSLDMLGNNQAQSAIMDLVVKKMVFGDPK
jgi:hypothetical protein